MPVEVGLGVRNAELKTGLEEAKESIAEFASEFSEQLFAPLAGLATVEGITEGSRELQEYGERLVDLGERFNVPLAALQRFGFAAKANGLELGDMALAFNRLEIATSRALQGNEADVRAFERLGVTLEDLHTKSPEDLMLQIGRGSMDAADMTAILGRNAESLIPTLSRLADGSQALGSAMDDEVVKSLARANNEIETLQNRLETLSGTLAAKIGTPMLDDLLIGLKAAQESLKSTDGVHQLPYAQRLAEIQDFAKRWGIDQENPLRPRGGAVSSPGTVEVGPGAQLSLAARIAEIDSAAAEKKLSAEKQIADLRQKQEAARVAISQTDDRAAQKEIIEQAARDEEEIFRIQAEADRAHAEAVEKVEAARLKAEKDYQDLVKQNSALAVDVETDATDSLSSQQRGLLQERAAALKQNITNMKKELDDYMDEPGQADPEYVNRILKGIKEAQGEYGKIDSRLKADDRENPWHDSSKRRETSLLPQGGIESIGGRLSGADYGHGNLTATTDRKQMIDHLKSTADDVHWIKQQYQTGTNTATFVGI